MATQPQWYEIGYIMRTILITGGASGIGAGIARRLVREGARVVIADTKPAGVAGARGEICDVSDEAQVNALVAGIAAAEGSQTRVQAARRLLAWSPASPARD